MMPFVLLYLLIEHFFLSLINLSFDVQISLFFAKIHKNRSIAQQLKEPKNQMERQFTNHIDVLYNDLYQFTCSFSYFNAKKHQDQATFEVFFRKHPFGGQYAIFAGVEAVRKFIKNFKITKEHERFLKGTLPNLTPEYLQWLKQDFTDKIKVKSFREGSIVFAREPLISYTGPLGFVQILETPILNLLGFATLVATNASRMAKAIYPKKCVEFGIRRAQGPDGGLSASTYAVLGGFQGTSNMKASEIYHLPCVGTMSHAFITSFTSLDQVQQFQINNVSIVKRSLAIRDEFGFKTHEGQLAAFLSYARSFSHNFKTLIDTYSTLESGILNTIIVSKALYEAGISKFGARLDSGDLCDLSKQVRKIWNKYVPDLQFTILASDDLHEERLIQMEAQGSEIDIYAIGTHIATCKKQPALGLVCKLTEINKIPKMKFSSDPDKATLPGSKIVFRAWVNEEEKASFDLIALEGEEVNFGENTLYTLSKEEECVKNITKMRKLNQTLDVLNFSKTLMESKEYMKRCVKELPESIFDLKAPSRHPVLMTSKYFQTLKKAREYLQVKKQ